jgi:putative hydrolase of the HAD superfamily
VIRSDAARRIKGISLDLGNTIYPFGLAQTRAIIARLHAFLEWRLSAVLSLETLNQRYLEIRTRQFAENRATLRENDFGQRLYEMIAAVHSPPTPDLVREAEKAYAAGFVDALRLPERGFETVKHLSERFEGKVAVCSNFILSDPIRDLLARDGLLPLVCAVVVSCDIGFIKPHPKVFEAASHSMAIRADEIAHVGDDLDADIRGAREAGMLSIFTSQFLDDAPASDIDAANPDICVAELSELRGLFC